MSRSLLMLGASLAAAAATAIRGANSWDALLGNWNETQILDAAGYVSARLLQYGYDHVTTDEGWYWTGGSDNDATVDGYGRPTPRLDQYPSAAGGVGFTAIADKVHALGLRFGVWTIRGIPKVAAANKLPIFNTSYTVDQAVSTDKNCSWNNHCYGCAEDGTGSCNPAAWAYYRSVASWYSQQHIDLVKIDCMWDQRFTGTFDADVIAFTTAFQEVGITVSLSPGPVSVANGTWAASTQLAKQYRVTNDFWDQWGDGGEFSYPTGLRLKLDIAMRFASLFGRNDTSPDLDMLPLGYIQSGAHTWPGGNPVPTKLTQDEQTMVITLWSAVGAPLLFGGRLPLNESDPVDAWTYTLITNSEVLLVHNESINRQPMIPINASQTYAWTSVPTSSSIPQPAVYISLYNGDEVAHDVTVSLVQTALPPGRNYCARDLWNHTTFGGTYTATFASPLAPHQAGMYLLSVC